jgi:putative PEP-CTERM system histidine kinase
VTAVAGHLAAALAWAALAAMLAARGPGRREGGALLVAAAALEACWAAAMAASQTWPGTPRALVLGLEALRPLGWTALLLAQLSAPGDARRHAVLGAALLGAAAIAIVHAGAPLPGFGARERFAAGLLAAVALLLAVEQVVRGAGGERRWALKFGGLAIGATAALDLVLYSDALVSGRIDYAWWTARGWAHALLAPLVAISAARLRRQGRGLRVSHALAFHSATLLASGAFLLAVAAIGYGLRLFGESWGGVARTLVFFGSGVALVAFLASGALRARLRVLIARHVLDHRYDYRAQWLRLTELLAAPADQAGPDAGAQAGALAERALLALAELVESPGGALWLRDDDGAWHCRARIGGHEPAHDASAPTDDEPLLRRLRTDHRILELPGRRAHPERHDGHPIPAWLADDARAWLVVPLQLQDAPIGIAVLHAPLAPVPLDWEVHDVLRTAGRQVAGTLAVQQAVERLAQARQFESFDRMSAFVVHDLKNLATQLDLLLRNAQRHAGNPDFTRDMLSTVGNVLDRMQGLLLQLRPGARPIERPAPVCLGPAVRAAVAASSGLHPLPADGAVGEVAIEVEVDASAELAQVVAHRNRLERVIGHLVQNAVEATPADGRVRVAARREGDAAVIEVRDTGSGMSPDFVRTRLFRPFESTKRLGMGIGAFESREYVREIGGGLSVASAEGAGSTFTLRLPLHRARPAPPGTS